MARLARAVVPDYPHHVTQRGNRRQQTFFCDDDYAAYTSLLAAASAARGTEVWAYCLMPNHVHLLLVPKDEDGLRFAMAETHRRYTRRINLREGWRGHLWQERFQSFVLDELYLLGAARYIEKNPVRAGLCGRPEDWPWSSARAHLTGADDDLVRVAPLLERVRDWRAFLGTACEPEIADKLRAHTQTGRPLGSDEFVRALEARLNRPLRPQKRGPKPKRRETVTRDLLEAEIDAGN